MRTKRNLGVGSAVSGLKARAVLIDTECGVLNSLMAGPLSEIFDSRQLISDQYGAGNNWAQGYMEYGPKYQDAILESIRHTVEYCDSLQSFFLMHSLGGGTGSGLGTYVLSLLADHYPDVYRFTTSVFPSHDDDVVTSPYNSALALNQLSEFADCVLPVENQALADICRRVSQRAEESLKVSRSLARSISLSLSFFSLSISLSLSLSLTPTRTHTGGTTSAQVARSRRQPSIWCGHSRRISVTGQVVR